jgi:hypothetical protein
MIKKFNIGIDVAEYFDGGRIPDYETIIVSENENLYDILMAESEQNKFISIAGYLDKNRFSYYNLAEAGFNIDFSKERIVIFVPDSNIDTLINQHVIFNFISSQARIIWFATDEELLRIEKTRATYKLCEQINKIFNDHIYFRIFMDMVINDRKERTMYNLMDIMYVFNLIEPIKKILNWENHYENVMRSCFKLRISKCHS